jgi:hypothetical protein
MAHPQCLGEVVHMLQHVSAIVTTYQKSEPGLVLRGAVPL